MICGLFVGFLFLFGLLCLSFHQQSIAGSELNSARGTPSIATSSRSSSVSFDSKDRLLVLQSRSRSRLHVRYVA